MLDYWNHLSNKAKVLLVLKVFVGILFLLFVIKNWQSTEVNLVFFKIAWPLTIVIGLSAVFGALIASIWFSKKIAEKNKKIQGLSDQLIQKNTRSDVE